MSVVLDHARQKYPAVGSNFVHYRLNGRELSFAAVDQYERRILKSVLRGMVKPACQDLPHGCKVVLLRHRLHLKETIGCLIGLAVLEYDHTGADIIISEIRDIE